MVPLTLALVSQGEVMSHPIDFGSIEEKLFLLQQIACANK